MKRTLLPLSVLLGFADVVVWQWTLAVNRARIAADRPPPLEYSTAEIVIFYCVVLAVLLAVLAMMKRLGSAVWALRVCRVVLTLWVLRGIGVVHLSQAPLDSWSLRRSEAQADHLSTAVCGYLRSHGSFPAALADLGLSDAETRDAWGFKFGLATLPPPRGVRLFVRGAPSSLLRDPLWREMASQLDRELTCGIHVPRDS